MVYAFIIQTLNQHSCDVLYYRVYSSYDSVKRIGLDDDDDSSVDTARERQLKNHVLFDSTLEKKDLINHLTNKIQMQYCLKLKHSILPGEDLKDSFIKGVFMERGWKEEAVPVIWQGIPGLGFSMICKKSENLVQAHNVMDIITNQLEKHLQFISNPVIPLRLIETVALIVNQYLPSGQLLYINSKLLKVFEKQLETGLFAK